MSGARRVWVVMVFVVLSEPLAASRAADPPAKPQAVTLPVGAVARLGQTRLRHADKPTCVAFAPDGKTFITGGDDGTLRVWSVATGEQVNMLQKPGLGVTALQVTHGGKRLAAQFGSDGVIRFLDANTLREVGSTAFINRHRFDFSADGKFMVTSDLAGNAVITEVENDLPKLEVTNANLFSFRPDGKAIAVGDVKGTVTVHLVTGGKPTFTLKQEGAITGLAYSPDGKRLAVGSHAPDGTDTIRVFELGKEKPVAEISGMSLPRAWIGTDSLACGNGAEAGVYDLAQKKWAGRVNGIAGEFAVSPDGTLLAATGTGLRVRLYDLTTGKQLHAENDSYPDPALLIGSPDSRELFTLSTDTAYRWKIGDEGAKVVGALPGRAVAAAFGGGALVVATPKAVIVYAKFDPTKPLPAKPTLAFKDSAGAKAVAVSGNGSRVAWALDGGKVIVTDTADKEARRELPITTTTVLALGFNPNGERLGVLGRDPFLRMWDVSDDRDEAKEVWKARVQRGQKGAVAFSPDGKLVTAVSTGQLLVFNVSDGKNNDEIRKPLFSGERYSDNGPIHHAAFSPDSRLLIVGAGGLYGRVEVWEVATRDLARTFTTGYGGTSRMCVFPDGTRIASAGAEEAVTVWDLTFRHGQGAPKPSELVRAASDLVDSRASVGYPAVKVLAAAGNSGAEQLATALKEIIANEKKIKGWVTDLGSETFSVREIASRELVAQGSRAFPALQVAANADDPEVRDRAREVVERLHAKGFYPPAHGLFADQLRLFRAVQALEEIGTPEAKKVLESIAAVGGRAGAEAKAALSRMKR
jgi:WD40 repeat protein